MKSCSGLSGELETERALLHTVLEQMPGGVIIAAAPSGRFLLANRQLAAILGRPVPMAENLQDYDHYRGLHPDGRPFGPQDYPLARFLTSGKNTLEEEINFIRGDGSRGVIQVSAAPVRNAEGRSSPRWPLTGTSRPASRPTGKSCAWPPFPN